MKTTAYDPYRHLPLYLYKYSSFDELEYSLQFFLDGSIFCSSPLKFNDPFDSYVKVDYSRFSESSLLKKLGEIIKHLHPEFSSSQVQEQAVLEVQAFDKQRLTDKNLLKQVLLNHLENKIGVYSLSAEKNNILLWSHYAASHTGFVIEFNALYLKNFLINTYGLNNQKRLLLPVTYSHHYKKVDAFSSDYYRALTKAFLTKAKVWSYENEWRIIYYGAANIKMIIPLEIMPDLVNCVVLGSKISIQNESKIASILNKINIPIFKAIQSENKYVMEYVQY